jgi:FKBP-type peptidyl-prolyl cis-trans isomerase 2
MAKKATKKTESHNHEDHAGHSHEGHDHSHEGHDHQGHDHAHDIPHTKVTPRKANTSGLAEDGNVVLVHYKGTLDSGEMFDSSEGRDPIEFVLGEHMVIRGFEEAITGMKKGETKKIVIESREAYGDVNPELRQDVPREALGEITPEVGMMLALQHPMAPQPIPVKVVNVTPETVTIDLNHPLAGQRLHFDLELVEIR